MPVKLVNNKKFGTVRIKCPALVNCSVIVNLEKYGSNNGNRPYQIVNFIPEARPHAPGSLRAVRYQHTRERQPKFTKAGVFQEHCASSKTCNPGRGGRTAV